MRLPLSKVYRAFPELDRFDDAACKRFVEVAKHAKPASHLAIAVLVVPLYFGGASAIGWAFLLLVPAPRAHQETLVYGTGISIAVAMPAIVVLLIRDLWLRWAIRSLVGSTRCFCGYSLLGLEIESGAVQCPEWGERMELADRRLTPEMLLAGELAATT